MSAPRPASKSPVACWPSSRVGRRHGPRAASPPWRTAALAVDGHALGI
ncbi:MAG: hypothetical protein ABSC73_01870 [Acidimicrobiales bacterium]